MFRNAAVRAAKLSGRRLQSTAASTPVLAQAEQTFAGLPRNEQVQVINRLNEVMKGDWTKVSLEDKKAIYYATYGAHNFRRPHVKAGDNTKVIIGVIATLAISVTISSLVRSS
ncbi:cytochrome c oxidase, partial [Dipsacomyces acuminosporus]